MNSQLLKGKTGLIMGIANEKSIACGIANMLTDMGADLYLTYQSDIIKKRLEPIAKSLNCKNELLLCDVCDDDSLKDAFKTLSSKVEKIDFIVHSIAFSDKNELKGRYLDTSRDNFLNTMDVSCYSLVNVCKAAENMLSDGASILTLTYYGSEKVVPNYNVMGVAKAALEASVRYLATDLGQKNIRVNAISAGAIRTLAASGINNFRSMLKTSEFVNPLKRTVTQNDIAGAAAFLISNLSSGITGEIIHVDCGFHSVAMSDNTNEE